MPVAEETDTLSPYADSDLPSPSGVYVRKQAHTSRGCTSTREMLLKAVLNLMVTRHSISFLNLTPIPNSRYIWKVLIALVTLMLYFKGDTSVGSRAHHQNM